MGSLRLRGRIWHIKYWRDGRPYEESSHSAKESDAKRLLKLREGDIEHGVPITPQVGRLKFDDAAKDLITDYTTNGRKSADHVHRRIDLALAPYFRGRRMVGITTADIRAFIAKRQQAGAANATINRELSCLKRMFTLAVQAGRLVNKPHIPMLQENNTRRGFLEPDQFAAVRDHLPTALQPLVTVGYFTGWRKGELLSLQWRNIDLTAKTIRLDPGTTKNRDGRLFVYAGITELEDTITELATARDALRREGTVVPYVFNRDGKPIKSFRRAWLTACKQAGVPGRLVHDLRPHGGPQPGTGRRPALPTAMAMVGQKTESIYRRYAIVSESDLKAAAAKLQAATVTITVTMAHPEPSSGNLPNRATA